MSRFLSIETSGDACSISLITPDEVRSLETDEPRSHAKLLVPLVRELLHDAPGPLDGICVDAGPGSYTGLRIGASTAKGLAWSLGCPLYAISSLELIAASIGLHSPEPAQVRALLPSRGEACYSARFRGHGMEWIQTDDVRFAPIEELLQSDPEGTLLVAPEDGSLPADMAVLPVRNVALHSALAAPLLRNQSERYRVQELSAFEPLYVRSFVARKPSVSIFDRLPF